MRAYLYVKALSLSQYKCFNRYVIFYILERVENLSIAVPTRIAKGKIISMFITIPTSKSPETSFAKIKREKKNQY